jgi:hypothetical protein
MSSASLHDTSAAAAPSRRSSRRLGPNWSQPGGWTASVEDWSAPRLSDPFDRAIEWTLYALLAFMPLALGAVEAWSELVVSIGATALALLLAARLIVRRDARFVWSWTYVPMVLFGGLLAIQLVPLPAGIVGAISPGTLKLKTELLADLPDAQSALRKLTLSFYPRATAHDLRLVLAASAIFVVVVNVFRRSGQIKRLLTGVAAIGAAIAAIALLQNVTGAKRIYWTIENPYGTSTAGTFVNYNNFSQFMNLSIGAALAVLLIRLREVLGAGGRVLSRVKLNAADPELRPVWVMGGIVVLGAASVILSMSRMGTISMLVAGLLTGVLLVMRKDSGVRAWLLAPIALAVFVALLWFGFDRIYDRLATLRQLERAEGGRVQTLKDLPAIWRQFPVLGIGSGAHETVYPMVDNHPDAALSGHVENEYAQVMEEEGAVGLALVVVFAGMIGFAWWRGQHGGTSVPVHPAALGLSFGLIAVLIHSASDFGQRLPAVAGLSAVTCGVLVVLAQRARETHRSRRNETQQKGESAKGGHDSDEFSPRGAVRIPALRLLSGVTVVAALGWSLLGAVATARAESAWNASVQAESHFARHDWEAGEEGLQRMMRQAEAAVALDPSDVHYQHGAAALRWRVLSTDPNRRDAQTGNLLLVQEDLDEVNDIVAKLHAARRVCPTFGANLSLAGQLERFVLDRPEPGAAHIREGYRLARNNPTACFVAGYLDAIEGRADDSREKMAAAVRLDYATFNDVMDVYVRQVGRPDLAIAVAGDVVGRLLKVADALQLQAAASEAQAQQGGVGANQELKQLAERTRAAALAKLRERVARTDAPAAALAQMAGVCLKENDPAGAVDYYRRALAAQYGQIAWRLELARALAKTGDVQHAIEEAEVCLRLRPDWAPAKKLISDLSVLPGAVH